jgi:Mn2+/Fe2+ NRAMP family transporter
MKNILKTIGPGIVVAATGIGAGDMIAATVGGAKYGYAILWAVIIGGILKYILNEGVGRWQLATGTSISEGWHRHLPKIFSWYFLVYLVLWAFIVSAALIAATGLAAHSLFPFFSVKIWGLIHSVVALIIVFAGNYKHFENFMKIMIALMFVVVIVSTIMINPDIFQIVNNIFNPQIPKGGVKYALAIIGGVGGSVTILSYGYWINEKGWKGMKFKGKMKIDLAVAYILTTLFGISIIIISANLKPEIVGGSQIVISLAEEMKSSTGEIGKWIFLIGFWGAVFSSMLGVWQGVPYIFADFTKNFKKPDNAISNENLTETLTYKISLLIMAILPFSLLFLGKPVWLIVLYAVAGSLFMPYLAITLLYLNNKSSILNKNKNSILVNIFLAISLLLFLYLGIVEIFTHL